MPSSASRRTILAGGLAGLGTAARSASAGPTPSTAPSGQTSPIDASDRPSTGGRTFTLAVIPDTQYLFDDAALHPEPLEVTLSMLTGIDDLAFVAHLGDVTQNGLPHEVTAAAAPFSILRRNRIPFSLLAGNHDVDSSTDDQRGVTPFLRTLAPLATRNRISQDGGGYNTAYTFTGAGVRFLLLALDWRVSDPGIAWAQGVLDANHDLPTIVTVHDAVSADSGTPLLSEHGERIWDRLIARNRQIFLSLNGHWWPTGRLSKKNIADLPVELHLANYQEHYYGGAAAVRLYAFDLDRGVVDVTTEVPFAAADGWSELEREELKITSGTDRFAFALPSALSAKPVRGPRPAKDLVIPGTLAYWRFDGAGPLGRGAQVTDASGQGNDLVLRGVATTPPVRVADSHPSQPSRTSLRFTATKDTGGYLQTVPTAPLNDADLNSGYTFEAFFHLPEPFPGDAAWSAIISRWGSAKAAGRISGDVDEPVATLSISGGRELQWCVYPTNLDRSLTNWGHELRTSRWWHVAVVNDTKHTTMYVDGCPVVRNPATVNRGLIGGDRRMPWVVGAYSWAGELDKTWIGTIGDVRIVSRPLSPGQFMIA